MMHLGHLRPLKSNYTSPLHMVPSKAELHGSKIFSRIDLVKAYHQIPIHPDDIHKKGNLHSVWFILEYTNAICNASATFQRFIDEVTRGLPGTYAFVDEILIASKNPQEHYQHLKNLFSKQDGYGICINVSKCIFGTSSIGFLGFNLSEKGIKPLTDKGIAASTKLICSRYVWPGMKCQINEWVWCCESCQKSKIQRHIKTPQGTFSLPDARFSHIHIDNAGPLQPSEGCYYLLTIIDHFSGWPEAVPIPDMQAKTICSAIFDTWVSL
ncbi:retrovirus-related Pol polyprotein from transposon opus [Trichonephila clavipes]|nr:retrovirus-related Pol polyprotein from transposon opus [Trichonephila clavipes]